MFQPHDENGYRRVIPGVEMKTLVYGEKTLMAKFRLQKGGTIPRHAHPHEQTGYLLEGRLRFIVGADAHEVGPGDSWCIAGGIEHGVEVLEDAAVLEAFSPVREDYLPAKGERK
jgi:quercetin dioxygenase-like cupin family protein